MAALKKFIWSLGSDNIPLTFILIGVVMLVWIFFGDTILKAVG